MKCPLCQTEYYSPSQYIGTGDPVPKPVGYVVRSTSFAVYHCSKCRLVLVDPYKWQYDGDGDFISLGRNDDQPFIIDLDVWNEHGFKQADYIRSVFAARYPQKPDAAAQAVIDNADANRHKKPNMRTLAEEYAEAVLADRGKHDDPLRLELVQIAGVCLNMIRRIDSGEDVSMKS